VGEEGVGDDLEDPRVGLAGGAAEGVDGGTDLTVNEADLSQ
jgi:hypothetical protein